MFRRWAEARMYRRTVQIAVSALRGASRAADAREKLKLLDLAEQKLKDALWLDPEASQDGFQTGLEEIQRSRRDTLSNQALPAVERLLDAAGADPGEPNAFLRPAGELLAFVSHYAPEEADVQVLSARFRELGGQQPPYQPIKPLSEQYRRSSAGIGCAVFLVGLSVALVVLHIVLQ
jgi:hypothetical protein